MKYKCCVCGEKSKDPKEFFQCTKCKRVWCEDCAVRSECCNHDDECPYLTQCYECLPEKKRKKSVCCEKETCSNRCSHDGCKWKIACKECSKEETCAVCKDRFCSSQLGGLLNKSEQNQPFIKRVRIERKSSSHKEFRFKGYQAKSLLESPYLKGFKLIQQRLASSMFLLA